MSKAILSLSLADFIGRTLCGNDDGNKIKSPGLFSTLYSNFFLKIGRFW